MNYLIGADESGAGPFAGLLTVVAVKANQDWTMEGLNDSKKLSAKKREVLLSKLMSLVGKEITYSLSFKTSSEIDADGLALSLDKSYLQVIKEQYCTSSNVIWDGSRHINGIESICSPNTYKSLIKADAKIPHVMAASIIAKCYRDKDIHEKHIEYPQYNWLKNSGYGTAEHLKAIKEFGYSPYHRKSYKIKI